MADYAMGPTEAVEPMEQAPLEGQVQKPSALSDRNIQMLQDRNEFLKNQDAEIKKSEQSLSTWKKSLVRYYELYQMVQSNRNYDGVAKIFVPETMRAVETLVAKLYQMLVGTPNWLEYTGREPNDDKAAGAMTELVRYQIGENNFNARLLDSLRQLTITGLTVRKLLWDFRMVRRKNIDQNGQQRVSVDVVNDFWTFEPVDLLTFHISDINTPYNDIQKARWIAEQYKVDKEWVYERMRKGWFSSAEKQNIEKSNGMAYTSDAFRLKESKNKASGFNDPKDRDCVEIVERWGLLPAKYVHTPEEMAELGLEPSEPVEAVCVIANRSVILKLEANPFWHGEKPYVACPYVAKEGEFAGMGVAQIGEKLQEELNDTRNQTMDNKTLILNTMWLKTNTSGIKNDQLRIRPQGVITTNDVNGLVPLRPPVLTGVGVNIENIVKEDFRQSVGAASNLQGIQTGGVDTATESSIINRESLGRLLLTAQLYLELILKPTFRKAEFLNYQFYDHVKSIKVIGELGVRFRNLSPEEIRSSGSKDLVITMSIDATENPATRRQQVMNFLTLVQQLPPHAIRFHWKLLDKIYKMFFHNRSLSEIYDAPPMPEELLTPEEEVEMVLAGQPVLAKQGQDHKQHIMVLEELKNNTEYALPEDSFQILKSLLMSHYQLLQQEIETAQQEFIAQQMSMLMGAEGQEGASRVDKRTPNASPFTQTDTPNPADLAREAGSTVV